MGFNRGNHVSPMLVSLTNLHHTAPVGPPTDIVIHSSATSVTLQWLPPYDPEGEVVSYGITYHLVDSSANISTPRPPVTISDIYETQITLEPLLQSSEYNAVVYAITSIGVGPGSELTLVTTAPGKSRQREKLNKTVINHLILLLY